MARSFSDLPTPGSGGPDARRRPGGRGLVISELLGERLERLPRKMLRGFPAVRHGNETPDILQKASLRLLQALHKLRPDSIGRSSHGL